ncbi:carbohydrate ABC transporter permease [Streptomyces avermitilis]|uniref:carbohydrate ABC transporter permease n=1 Tax=Streptomyces avermitilis TaxID=33903 RepID=UPI00380B565A
MTGPKLDRTQTASKPSRPGGLRRRRNLARATGNEGVTAFWLTLPAVVVVAAVVLYPILRTLLISLFRVDSSVAVDTPFVGLGNYLSVVTDPGFRSSMGRTLYFTVVSTTIELALGFFVALLLNAKLHARWLFRAIIVVPWALPTVVNAAMWRGIFDAQYGPLNAILTQLGLTSQYHAWLADPTFALHAVIIADVWKTTPLVAFFMLTGLTSIPDEVYEAARIDRAGWVRVGRSIVIPMLMPAIAIVLVLRTVDAFKVFDVIYVMTRGGPVDSTQTVAYYAFNTAFSEQHFGTASALSYVIVLVIFALTTQYLRLLRRSETSLL